MYNSMVFWWSTYIFRKVTNISYNQLTHTNLESCFLKFDIMFVLNYLMPLFQTMHVLIKFVQMRDTYRYNS